MKSFRSATTILLALTIIAPTVASAEFMSEADRRAQRTALQENISVSGETDVTEPVSLPKDVGDYAISATEEPNVYPGNASGTIVIETRERQLHYIVDGETMITYPIAVGKEGAQWSGTTSVIGKKENPEWRPTPNMRKKNPKLPVLVKAGPANPLGIRAIYLAEGYLRIHGTNAPDSIGKAASSGCYRMHNEDVVDLFERVSSGAKVIVRQ